MTGNKEDDIYAANTENIPEFDPVNKPKHYNSHPSGIECRTIARHHSFNIGNVFKYCWRAGLKGVGTQIQDLEKAANYLNDEIEMLKKIEAGHEEQ